MTKGDILKKYRLTSNLTQSELASQIGVTVGYISNIETSKKRMTDKVKEFLLNEALLTLEETNILNQTDLELATESYSLKKIKLLEQEKLINDTYSFIRENNYTLSKVASIQTDLIDLNNYIDNKLTKIEFSLSGSKYDLEVIEKLKRPFKTTIKRLEDKIKKIEELSSILEIDDKQGGKMNEFSYLREYMPPFHVLKKEHKEIAVQTWIANNLRYRWKDYKVDSPGFPSPHSERLWGAGRGEQGRRGYMRNNVEEDFKLQTIGAENLDEFEEIVREIGITLIDRAVIVAEMLLKDARNAKTPKVRNNYNRAINDREFLINLLRICVHLYALKLVEDGTSLECLTLESRVKASIDSRAQLSKIWTAVSKGTIEFEEAIRKTEEISVNFEKSTYDDNQIERLGFERMMMEIAGDEVLKDYIYEIMDKMVQRLTGKLKIFDVYGESI